MRGAGRVRRVRPRLGATPGGRVTAIRQPVVAFWAVALLFPGSCGPKRCPPPRAAGQAQGLAPARGVLSAVRGTEGERSGWERGAAGKDPVGS